MSILKKILIYEDKPEFNNFELLETENEGEKNEYGQKQETQNSKLSSNDSSSILKTPLKVDEWNKSKKEEKNNKPSALGGMLDTDLNKNIRLIEKEFNIPKNQDAIIKDFNVARKIKAVIVYIDGMVDRATINNFVLRQLMTPEHFNDYKDGCPLDYISKNILSVHQTVKLKEFNKIVEQVLNGLTALFIDGCDECLVIESRGYEKRNVEGPTSEKVVRGSNEAFNENMRTNITLIRRIIRNKDLITEILPVGKTNNSSCAILYLDDVANPDLVEEVKRRIKSIDYDLIMGDGMLEQFIEDEPFMLLPQTLSTERPDRTASFITQGQVAIIADGSPFVLIVPVTFFSMFHTSEDTNMRWQWGTALRLIRMLALFFAVLLPGLYAALTLYHQEMIPTDLLASIAKSRELVPFPTIIELLIMEMSFELIREAGERVPGVIGPTIGIIGALILGQAAVTADIVSPILIIVVAITGLGNFAIPNYSMATAVRILRFIFIFFGAIAGFYGVSAAIVILGGIACSMKSFGVPYFTPIAPRTRASKDLIIRHPVWQQKRRPDAANSLDRIKAGRNPNWYVKKKREEDNDDKGR